MPLTGRSAVRTYGRCSFSVPDVQLVLGTERCVSGEGPRRGARTWPEIGGRPLRRGLEVRLAKTAVA